jgi:hypothetical protein
LGTAAARRRFYLDDYTDIFPLGNTLSFCRGSECRLLRRLLLGHHTALLNACGTASMEVADAGF